MAYEKMIGKRLGDLMNEIQLEWLRSKNCLWWEQSWYTNEQERSDNDI